MLVLAQEFMHIYIDTYWGRMSSFASAFLCCARIVSSLVNEHIHPIGIAARADGLHVFLSGIAQPRGIIVTRIAV